MPSSVKLFFFSVSILGIATISFADAQATSADDCSKERAKLMKDMDAAVANIGQQTSGLFPYEKKRVLAKAEFIEKTLDDIDKLFPKGSESTSTKKNIWKKPKKFQKMLDKARSLAGKLIKTIKKKDKYAVAKVNKSLFKACGNCHAEFRQ
ncbi:cytochrome c [Magnetospira sp. QH-2]|uniref:cytochrome c n=1 Tax=Magnetospira sp. (strain QH-2) TaxID=1288970 RepID=UPI0003E81B7E|nr:cytochrome c [Magnetospira sp. QH-2]CCQ73729.1 putative Cytochrome c-556 [Magnetospira sp. QH-2]